MANGKHRDRPLWRAELRLASAVWAAGFGRTEPLIGVTARVFLSWSGDGTLRLWDAQSGAPLAILAGHTDWVEGARVLPDGRILSWSESFSVDHTLRLWDGQSGKPVGEPISDKERCWVDQWLLFQRSDSPFPAGHSCQTVPWSFANTGGIATCAGPVNPVRWHGNSRVVARNLLNNGILLMTLDSGHVFCLQLYRGARRITIQEYEHP